jgi:NitT/TauT family transport system ATP-binding protein
MALTEGPALALDNITCAFTARGANAKSYTAVRDTTLTIGAGEFVSVVGPTGCGKSTLLNIAAGLLEPSAGSVRVLGAPLAGINRHAGYMFQSDALLPWLSARDNIELGLNYRGIDPAETRERAAAWLNRVGLSAHGGRYPHQLSGGMKKRVALAQMLILDPKILLMDEPFSALDIQTRQLMENELLELWSADRKSVVFITHDLEEAISLSDRVVVMSAGPASHPLGEFAIDLPRPRDVAEVRMTPRFVELHTDIWRTLKDEVLKGYAQSQRR